MPATQPAAGRGSGAADEALWGLAGLLRDRAEVHLLLEQAHALRLVADRVREVTGADAGFVGRVEPDGTMVIRHWSGTLGTSLHDLVVPAGLGVGGKVLLSMRPLAVDDYLAAPSITHHFDEPVRLEGLRSLAAVPFVARDTVRGVIYAGQRETAGFGDVAIDSMLEVSRSAGMALELQEAVATSTSARVDDERRELALRLHDSVGAALFGIGASVRDMRSGYGANTALLDRLAHLEDQVSDAARALRDALAALSGAPDARALAAAIHSDCRAFEERTGVPARFVPLCDAPELGSARQHVLRRFVREALLNVEKHSRATSVVVSLAAFDDGITVGVTDDGVGTGHDADPDGRYGGGSGLGLESLRDSLEQLAGKLSVVANEDGGTTVRASVPYL